MKITKKQIINPAIFNFNKKRNDKLKQYKIAVKEAMFLNDEKKKKWITLGYLLSNKQLTESEKIIINQNLKYLKRKEILEKIKPIKQ